MIEQCFHQPNQHNLHQQLILFSIAIVPYFGHFNKHCLYFHFHNLNFEENSQHFPLFSSIENNLEILLFIFVSEFFPNILFPIHFCLIVPSANSLILIVDYLLVKVFNV